MINFEYLWFEIKEQLKRQRKIYFSCIVCVAFGIVLGILICVSGESYLSLLVSNNKVLYSMISGTADIAQQFWSRLFSFLLPLLIIFLLGLNFYSLLFAFGFVIYQSAILVLSISAVVSLYGFSGIISSIFLTVPINILFFCIMFMFIATCYERAVKSKNERRFSAGFESEFWIKLGVILVLTLLLAFVSSFVIYFVLKSAIFSIY